MPSTFFGLNIAYSGLSASNAALNTTANNISNSETKGYSRQTVTQQAYDPLRTFATYGCAGAGVDVIAIERNRNEFYDLKYWKNASTLGEADKKQYYMEEIENYFTDDEKTSPGFTTIFNKMYDALQEVIKNAGSVETREQFVGSVQNLTDYFNTTAGNLQKVQADANSEVKVQVDTINSLSEQIATLNKQINTIELGGVTANELRDKRELLIDQLSAIVDVEVKETPIYDTNFPDRVTGAHRYTVTIGSGQMLVDMGDYNSLACISRQDENKINQSDIDGLYEVVWERTGAAFNLHNTSLGGSLKGLIDIRDGNNGTNFQGKVTGLKEVEDAVTGGKRQVVTVDVTADYLKDLKKCTLPEKGEITLANTKFSYESWTYDDTTGQYSFVLSPSNAQKASGSILNKEANVGDSIAYKGIPYYMEQMNEWVRSYAEAANEIFTQDGAVDGYGDPGQELFAAKDVRRPVDKYYYYKMTALNVTISGEINEDANKLATYTVANSGQDKYDVLNDLVALKTDQNQMNFRGGSSSSFLESILSDVALSAKKANTSYLNFTNMKNTIANQRLSISGVDQDEEALNMVKYGNAFTLAAKMIATLSECYDQLILNTGV